MMRFTAARWFVLALALAPAAGCGGSEKELPKDVELPPASNKEDAVIAIPAVSEPEAIKWVDKCIAAATEKHPERLEKLKVMRATFTGEVHGLGSVMPSRRKNAAVWPDRSVFENESSNSGTSSRLVVADRQGAITYLLDGNPYEPPLQKMFERDKVVQAEWVGIIWMPIFVPLADRSTIVFGAKEQTIGPQTWNTVQAAVPGLPVYTLWLDPRTHLLGAVTFNHSEGTQKVFKRCVIGDRKKAEGVLLPVRFEYQRNGQPAETWTSVTWEFPEKIDDSEFKPTK
jgi:hypothetical protein